MKSPDWKYRYLDLRSARMQRNMRKRDEVQKYVRDFLHEQKFIEVEDSYTDQVNTRRSTRLCRAFTPLPKTIFYALPQSPQQYKQLLMTAGIERYFPVCKMHARRGRPRRSPARVHPTWYGNELRWPWGRNADQRGIAYQHCYEPFFLRRKSSRCHFLAFHTRLPWRQYGSDRPDIRTDKEDPDLLAFCWVVDFPFFWINEQKWQPGRARRVDIPRIIRFSRPIEEHMDNLMSKQKHRRYSHYSIWYLF